MLAPSPLPIFQLTCLFSLLTAFTPGFYSVLSCFTQEKNTKVYAKQFDFDATKFKDFSRKNGIQELFKDSPKIQGLFKTMRILVLESRDLELPSLCMFAIEHGLLILDWSETLCLQQN